MSQGADEQVLDYPLVRPAALDPPPEWAQLRQECPVARVKLPSGDEASLITRYDDVKQVLSDTRFGRSLNAEGAARITDSESGGVFNSSVATVLPQTGEEHLRWRRMISKWFTAKRMNALRPDIEAMAERLVDEMVAHGAPADLKARGTHSCLGQALARTELQAVLDVLLRKLPSLELDVPAEELRRVEGLLVGGLREVPVRW